MRRSVADEIYQTIDVPKHITEIAAACAGDLLHGPVRVLLADGTAESFDEGCTYRWGDEPEHCDLVPGHHYGPHYTSPAADALRGFIEGLPTLYIDEDDCIHTKEPSPELIDWDDEDSDYRRCTRAPDYCELDRTDVVAALFGKTIAKEFR
jgi:hypothetical protein